MLALSYELKGNTEHKSVFIADCREGVAESRLQPCQKPELRLSKLSKQAVCYRNLTSRLHPAVALLIPRRVGSNVELNGFGY